MAQGTKSLEVTERTAPGDEPASVPVASVEDLRVTFTRNGSAIHALRGVSLSLQPAEIVALVGESGSGKSVLGLSLLGLMPNPAPATSGSVTVCGVDVLGADAQARRQLRRRHLGAVFQDPMTSLNPTMRIGAQVKEATGSVDESVRLLRAVGIADAEARLRAFPHELSGGLRQRVMIAMALAGSPSLVVADEPTTALDVTVQAQILDLVLSLRQSFGTTFLFITHDLAVARQVADRIIVMYGGRLCETGPASKVIEVPAHPYTAGLMRARVGMTTPRGAVLTALAGEPLDPATELTGCPFAARCQLHEDRCDEAVPDVHTFATDHGVACLRAGVISADAAVDGGAGASAQTSAAAAASARTAHAQKPLAVRLNDATKVFQLRKGWGWRPLHALRGVSLELAEGESMAVVGESGSGKSTLLRVVAGLVAPDTGTVDVEGERPQMVFQDAGSSLTPWLTVGEMLGERLRGRGLGARQRSDTVVETLASVGLPDAVARVKPHQLSGGQRQRVAIARALIVPPKVLLCDEPTSALDVSLAATVINLLGRLRRELGIAMIFVTHDLAVARSVADRVAVMYLGRIVEEGPTDAVCGGDGHPYTSALLAAVPGTGRREARHVGGEPPSPLAPPPGCAFHPRCPVAEPRCAEHAPLLVTTPAEHRLAACVKFAGRSAGAAET